MPGGYERRKTSTPSFYSNMASSSPLGVRCWLTTPIRRVDIHMSAAANATSTCHAALSAARASAANNSALALLLYSACSRAGGAATYFEHAWLPEPPQCTSATRFGPDGEGGKVVCDAGNRRHGLANRNGCLVVSVGLNDDTRAEQAIFRSHPHCLIEGYDGTLTAAKRRLLPPEGLVHIPHNFNAST